MQDKSPTLWSQPSSAPRLQLGGQVLAETTSCNCCACGRCACGPCAVGGAETQVRADPCLFYSWLCSRRVIQDQVVPVGEREVRRALMSM